MHSRLVSRINEKDIILKGLSETSTRRGIDLSEKRYKTVFIFLDTDKHASPFDILTTVDVLPDASILKYENVAADDAEKLIHDAMFPRGPQGARYTKIFINGHDFERANDILQRAKKLMFPPFEIAVMIDPAGAYTTASAAVVKTLQLSLEKGFGSLNGKNVTILAGTGPVGQTAARLYATEKASVVITSRSLEKASSVAAKINEEFGVQTVRGVQVQTSEESMKVVENADIVLSAGAAGIQLLPLSILRERGKKRLIVADINAIPPLGVEGLDSSADGIEFMKGIYGIGALVIGNFKNKVEVELIRRTAEGSKGIFDHKEAYEIAGKIMIEKKAEKQKTKSETQKHWLP